MIALFTELRLAQATKDDVHSSSAALIINQYRTSFDPESSTYAFHELFRARDAGTLSTGRRSSRTIRRSWNLKSNPWPYQRVGQLLGVFASPTRG